jgi:beta-galactosidase
MNENRQLTSSPEGLDNIRSLVLRDRNHPSVIMWSMENEEPIAGTPRGSRILATLARLTRRLDPTRPVATATNHDWNKAGYADTVDVLGYNYAISTALEDHQAFPERRLFASETHSTCCTRGVYGKDEVRAYCPSYPSVYPFWGGPPEKDWKLVAAHPELTGLFVWTGFDYKGEPIPYTWPNINCHFGVMDICGFPKDSFFYFKSAWTDAPMIHVFPHWNWAGREGQPVNVWVYSNCDEIELMLNGQSLGRRPLPRFEHLEWEVPYQPGRLEARGYRNGLAVAEHHVETAGPAARISLEPDRSVIRADGADVSVITARLVDQQGRPVPTAGNRLDFTVTGPGRLMGVGNGDPSCHERDKDSWRSAFNGLCMALVQSTDEAGTIQVRASSEGLEPVVYGLTSKPEAGS